MSGIKNRTGPSIMPAAPVSARMQAATQASNDTGPQMFVAGSLYYRQLDELAITLCVAKTITDAQWHEFLEQSLRLARQIGRIPRATMATFSHTYPDAKQRRQTRDYLATQKVTPTERVGLLSDSPLLRGASVAYSWLVPNASVMAFGSRDVAACLAWLRDFANFDERRASTAWNEGRAALRIH